MPPNHVPVYQPGTRLILFSPTEEMKPVNEAIMRNQQELQTVLIVVRSRRSALRVGVSR